MSTLEIIFWIFASIWVICFVGFIISLCVEALRDRYIYIYFMIGWNISWIAQLVINLFL